MLLGLHYDSYTNICPLSHARQWTSSLLWVVIPQKKSKKIGSEILEDIRATWFYTLLLLYFSYSLKFNVQITKSKPFFFINDMAGFELIKLIP